MKTSRRLGNGKPRRGHASKTKKSRSTSPAPSTGAPRTRDLLQRSRNIFARDNKLSTLFSSQTESTPDPTTRRANQLPYAEEDESFFERDSSPPLDIRRKKRLTTPPSQFQQESGYSTRDSPPENLSDDFFNILKPKTANKVRKLKSSSKHKTSQERLKGQLQSPLKGHNEFATRGDSNREHSQSTRRLSYNSRGRRVSSMGNGFEGEPHQDVPVSEYYKHLDKSIPESDRMRQLLIWNLKTELDKEENELRSDQRLLSAENQTVHNIAKTLTDELIQLLKGYSISTDWKDSSPHKTDSVLLPNPKNKTNLENIRKYTKELHALKSEKHEWESAYQRLTSLIDTVATEQDIEDFASNFKNQNIPRDLSLDPSFANVERNFLDIHQNLSKVQSDVDMLYFSGRQMERLTESINKNGKEDLLKEISKLLAKSLPKPMPQPDEKLTETKDLLRAICFYANTK